MTKASCSCLYLTWGARAASSEESKGERPCRCLRGWAHAAVLPAGLTRDPGVHRESINLVGLNFASAAV